MNRKKQRKYNKLTKEIEKDLDVLLNFITNDVGINILNKFRNRLYPEYRSLLNTYAFRKHILSPSDMSKYYNNKGLNIKHDNVIHSISKFESYCYSLPELKTYLNAFFSESKGENKEVKVINIDKRDLTPLQKLVDNLTLSEQEEIKELVELRIKSWKWKTIDNLKVYEGSY